LPIGRGSSLYFGGFQCCIGLSLQAKLLPCYAKSVQALHLLVLVGANPGSVLGVAVLQLTAEKESQQS
jgi:hypothetical protein